MLLEVNGEAARGSLSALAALNRAHARRLQPPVAVSEALGAFQIRIAPSDALASSERELEAERHDGPLWMWFWQWVVVRRCRGASAAAPSECCPPVIGLVAPSDGRQKMQ